MLDVKAFSSCVGIIVKASFRGLDSAFSVLNCYGSYLNREIFWNATVDKGIFNYPNLIIADDLNITLTDPEIWGSKARIDPLSFYFSQLLVRTQKVDIATSKLGPTWRNG